MPIYEFVCESCGNEFEQIQSFSDSSVPACVRCGSTQVVRRMGRPAIHFKGSGWYITDSKKSKDSKGNGSKSPDETSKSESTTESTAESASESTSGNKVETKSDSAKESKSDTGNKSESSPSPKSTPAPVASD